MKQKLIPYIDDSGKRHDTFFEDARTGIIYFKKDHNGKRIKFSTKVHKSKFVVAKKEANKEFDRRIGKGPKVRTHSLIKDEVDLWLLKKDSEGHDRSTMYNIKRAGFHIKEFWGDLFPSEITQDKVVEWYTFWNENHSDIDMENAVKYMKNFCRYLSQKAVDGRPLLAVIPRIVDPNHKTIRRRRKKAKANIFTQEDLKKILKTAESEEHQLIVLFMYTMASRVTETLSLSFDTEILLDRNPPIYQWSDGQNKADLEGFHALHPILIERLKKLYKKRISEGTTRLFPQQNDNTKPLREQQIDWAAWRSRADIGWHWSPHTFRHTCLSNLFNDEKNPQALICKLYRVSIKVAMDTYIKPTQEGIAKMRDSIKVDI